MSNAYEIDHMNIPERRKPKWTTEPPTEPGYYWWRPNKDSKKPNDWIVVYERHALEGGEWWPVPIEPPEE